MSEASMLAGRMATPATDSRLVYGGVRARAGRSAGIRTVLGDDGRSHVEDTSAAPWRMVCHLEIEGPFNTVVGTGWLAGPRTVVTAGHCVFDAEALGGWATRIRVSPGMRDGDTGEFGSIEATRFDAADPWRLRREADFDIGAIHLDTVAGQADLGSRLGWFGVASLPDAALRGAMVNVSGYPTDKPDPADGHGAGSQQWHARNRVTRVTQRRLFYDVDTAVGQSGGPAYVIDRPGAAPLVVGVHAYGAEGPRNGGGVPANSAPRITAEVVRLIREWTGAA